MLGLDDHTANERPVLCTGYTHDGRSCGNRPLAGTDRCGSHQRQTQPQPDFMPVNIKHGGSGVIPRTQQELELLANIDETTGFDLVSRVAAMQLRRLTKKVLLEPELKEAGELLQTVTHERGVMNGQAFSRTIQQRPDLEAQLDKTLSTYLRVTVESNKQNSGLTLEQQAAELTKMLNSAEVAPIDLDSIPGGDSDLFDENTD